MAPGTGDEVMTMKRFPMAVLATLLVASVPAHAAVKQSIPAKQTGGSTGDSSIVAADTSAVVTLTSKLTDLFVVVWADSQSIYTTQISPDGGTHWFTVDVDTVAAGTVESTGSLGKTYADMGMRVILDKISASGAGKSRAVIQEYQE